MTAFFSPLLKTSMEKVVVVPGTRLGEISDSHQPGDSTYTPDGKTIYASLAGYAVIDESTRRIHVRRHRQNSTIANDFAIPKVESIVTGKVTKITNLAAFVDILVVGQTAVRHTFKGIIRKQDVRSFEKDSVQIHKSFRPGDVVRAVVISLGDSQSYYLSTARDDLGVILAISSMASAGGSSVRRAKRSTGNVMLVPISWEQMQCPVTKNLEYRKCAKPTSIIKT